MYPNCLNIFNYCLNHSKNFELSIYLRISLFLIHFYICFARMNAMFSQQFSQNILKIVSRLKVFTINILMLMPTFLGKISPESICIYISVKIVLININEYELR